MQRLVGNPRRGVSSRATSELIIAAVIIAGAAAGAFSLLPLPGRGGRDPASHARTTATHGSAITGRASVIDGDTLEIHGTRIRLFGIDAPESSQTCLRDGIPIRCGQQSAFALAEKIGTGPITCVKSDTDRYGRLIAICRSGYTNLNRWMVSEGWAVVSPLVV